MREASREWEEEEGGGRTESGRVVLVSFEVQERLAGGEARRGWNGERKEGKGQRREPEGGF
jgi:hypothetical protein